VGSRPTACGAQPFIDDPARLDLDGLKTRLGNSSSGASPTAGAALLARA